MPLDTFDLMRIQSLLNMKVAEIKDEIIREANRIGCDLVEHINANFNTRTAGVNNVEDSKKIFKTQDHVGKKYERNTSCWAYGLDLTCVSPWNSFDGHLRAGTAITRHHVVFATHYPISVGSTMRFVTMKNEVVERKLSRTSQVFKTDITLALLDEPLPDSITPALMLPRFWLEYVATEYNQLIEMNTGILIKKFPTLCLDQEEKAVINAVHSIVGNKEVGCCKAEGDLGRFSEHIIIGDSGNPCFTIVDEKLVLLTTWNTGGWGGGPFLSGDTFIQKEMTLKSTLKEIQSKLHGELFPENREKGLEESKLNLVDLWRFRRVYP